MFAIDFVNAEITSISSRKDRSVRFSVETAELTTAQAATLLGYHGKAARVLVAPHGEDSSMVEVEEVTAGKDLKSPSEMLRNVIFAHWKQLREKHQPAPEQFSEFYETSMFKISEGYKRKNLSP